MTFAWRALWSVKHEGTGSPSSDFCNASLDRSLRGVALVDTQIDRSSPYLECIRSTRICGLYWVRGNHEQYQDGWPAPFCNFETFAARPIMNESKWLIYHWKGLLWGYLRYEYQIPHWWIQVAVSISATIVWPAHYLKCLLSNEFSMDQVEWYIDQ